jgi:hypothetical protein
MPKDYCRRDHRAGRERQTDFGRPLPGYFMSAGNQVLWSLRPVGIKMHFEAAEELGRR